jgi:hypothetical protein
MRKTSTSGKSAENSVTSTKTITKVVGVGRSHALGEDHSADGGVKAATATTATAADADTTIIDMTRAVRKLPERAPAPASITE